MARIDARELDESHLSLTISTMINGMRSNKLGELTYIYVSACADKYQCSSTPIFVICKGINQ